VELYPLKIKDNAENHALSKLTSPSSLFKISRTIQRPLGISSRGTWVSNLRYDKLKSSEPRQSQVVEVKALDVFPTLIKPRMDTLRLTLYHGGGAGGTTFVPPLYPDDQPRECLHNEIDTQISNATTTGTCGLVITLSELHDHKLEFNSDGSMLLERTVHLHPDSSLWMMLDFEEVFLPFQKFPADANRGVDVFPSRATFTTVMVPACSTTLYSPSLLLIPPVPDMSMPFNVISLSCTLWAFVLGSLLNILVRRGTESVKREFTGETEKSKLTKLKERIKEKGRKIKEMFKGTKKELENRNRDGKMKCE